MEKSYAKEIEALEWNQTWTLEHLPVKKIDNWLKMAIQN